MMRTKPKPRPSTIFFEMADVAKAVNDAIKLKLMRIDGNTFYVFKSAFPVILKAQEAYVKNLYYFAVLDKHIDGKDAFYLKDIESEQLIAFYKNNQVFIA